jgi:hypothetical protein
VYVSRAGLPDEDGLRCFDCMRLEHKVTPNGCMVDLMAHAEGWTDACAHREHVEAVVLW